jgi:hypothetical protein
VIRAPLSLTPNRIQSPLRGAQCEQVSLPFDITLPVRVDKLYRAGWNAEQTKLMSRCCITLPPKSDTVVCLGIRLLQLYILALLGLLGRQYLSGMLTSLYRRRQWLYLGLRVGQTANKCIADDVGRYANGRGRHRGITTSLKKMIVAGGVGGTDLVENHRFDSSRLHSFLYFPQTLFDTANEVKRS